jgi:site-specific DNA-cytosine methylase
MGFEYSQSVLNANQRTEHLASLNGTSVERPLDLLVIGGGVVGLGSALDASSRGLKVGLVEKGDFASGTSSKSSRLAHGGLRYLEQFELRNGIDILTQHVARPHRELDKEIYKEAVRKWNLKKERLNYNDLPERLKTHNNRSSFFDRFKVVAADFPYSQTVVAHIAKDGHYYIHADINQNRSISVREAARLQSFPDDYYFEGEKEGANRTAA